MLTGYGPGLCLEGSKNQTGPDFQTLGLPGPGPAYGQSSHCQQV